MKDKIQIICVEDGSVDIEELQDLKDGKVLVYRQGSRPPFVIDMERPINEANIDAKAFAKEIEQLICRFAYSCDRTIVMSVIEEFQKLLKFYGLGD